MQCVVFHSYIHLILWLFQTKNIMSNILHVPFFLPSSVRMTMSIVISTTPLALPRNVQGVIVPFPSNSWRSIGIIGANAGTRSAIWSINKVNSWCISAHGWSSSLLISECQDQLQSTSSSVHIFSGREWSRGQTGRRSRDSSGALRRAHTNGTRSVPHMDVRLTPLP